MLMTYLYLRETRQRRVDGSYLTHRQIAESIWDPVKRQTKIQILYNCGRADDPQVAERLRRLARSIWRRCSPEEIVSENPQWQLRNAWPYGELYVLEQLWGRRGYPGGAGGAKARIYGGAGAVCHGCQSGLCAVLEALLLEQWLSEEVRIAGTEGLELHQLYRAMDLLEANKEKIEQALYFRLANLLNLDVALIFYDTTSLHFEVDEEDAGRGGHDEVQGSGAAGAKIYRAMRKRGKSKSGREDAPQIVVGLAVTRDGFPVRHWVFPGNTWMSRPLRK